MNERRGISKFDLKQHNCSQILRVIRESEQTSRTDIADEIHLTRSSVTMLVNEMIKEGVLLEKDSFHPERTDEAIRTSCRYDRGRRKLCLSINDTYRFAASVCIEHNRLTVWITTLSLQLLESQSVAFSLTEFVEATVKKKL
ncbi:MAG: winged helix-turn-helix domain-containing protein [Ruminococcus sp.]|nr:winged helix-turn-helix domain-containing protein [Ruminococcus sp.]